MRTKDGKSGQFGFVGFWSEKESEEALKFFNSFMDTCRINCEIAHKVGDPNMPRPWSRHSLKKQQYLTEERKQVNGPKRSSCTTLKRRKGTARMMTNSFRSSFSEDVLEEHFSRFGNVSQVHVVVGKDTKQSKGFAYVLYMLPESAARALEELDNSIFQGRLIHVMPAKLKVTPLKQETNIHADQSEKFKKIREEERKASEASSNTRAWNTLFMRPDTVVENIARKFGASKSNLLDREADDIAVRIALGETQVIVETKKGSCKCWN